MKAPSRSILCEWVKASWAVFPKEMVKESFVSCAITTSIDGTDDDKIHCFNQGNHVLLEGPCSEKIQRKLKKHLSVLMITLLLKKTMLKMNTMKLSSRMTATLIQVMSAFL